MASEPKRLRQRNIEVEELIRASGQNQTEIAAYLTRTLGEPYRSYHVSRMVSGDRKVVSNEMDALRDLVGGVAEAAASFTPALSETSEFVPLFGYANAAGGSLRINEDLRIGVVPIHPAQRGSRQSYAFICFGDSVSPRLNHGETGYAVRNHAPFKGQLCVVRFTNGDALVKFYAGQDERTLFLRQLQPKGSEELRFPLRDIEALDAVVGASFGPS